MLFSPKHHVYYGVESHTFNFPVYCVKIEELFAGHFYVLYLENDSSASM